MKSTSTEGRLLCRIGLAFLMLPSVASLAQQHTAKMEPMPSMINPHYDHRYDGLVVKSSEGFTHPGILNSRAELNLMRDMVQQGNQPWARGFDVLREVPQAAKNYTMLGPYKRVEHGIGQYEFRRDATATYDQTILWYITGDHAYADNAIHILNMWSSTLNYFESDHITGGMGAQKFAAAAEILRYTPSSGWKSEEIEQFKKFLMLLKPSVDKPNLFMNQGGYGLIGAVSIAVFLNDADLYRRQIYRATVGDSKNPLTDPAISKTIWPSGQVVEMGRDQGHPQGGLGTLSHVAQTTYIQGMALIGVDLFTYLDNRLLKGFDYLAGYELGYDREYKPVDESGNKGYYTKLSTVSRGDLSPIFALAYNHYRYQLHVPSSELESLKEALDYHSPEGSSEDFPGFGTLRNTPLEAKEDAPPLGPPRERPRQIDPAEKYGRIEAASYSGSKGVSREYYTDASGHSRLIASQIKSNFSSWYDNVDFGDVPLDTLIVSAGSASPAGSKIDLMLDSSDAAPIATLQIDNTGWWSTFGTFTAKLKQPVSGRHTVYLRFYGGNHVYGFQCNLDWFKFAHSSAHTENAATDKDQESKVAKADNKRDASFVTMKRGSFLVFRNMDFDDGAGFLMARVATTDASTLTMTRATAHGERLATFSLPNTHGAWKTVTLPMRPEILIGKNTVVFVSHSDDIKLDRFEFTQATPRFPSISASRYSSAVGGVVEKRYGLAAVKQAGTTLAYPAVGFSNGVKTLAVRVASSGAGTIEVRTMDKHSETIAIVHVPSTGSLDHWQTVEGDMLPAGVRLRGIQMLFFTFIDQPMQMASFQFDPAGADH